MNNPGLPTNPVVQQLDLLLGGYAFNWYRAENQARADDLLVRERASGSLSTAVGALSDLHVSYTRRFIPPSTRENPFPSADEMRRAQDILALRDQIGHLDSAVRGMPVPTQDKIWKRLRGELELLNQLLSFDFLLIDYCDRVRDQVDALTPEQWREGVAGAEIERLLRDLKQAVRERQQMLMIA